MRWWIVILKILVSAAFGILFLRSVVDYGMNYYKFQLIDVIHQNGLGQIYHVQVFIQLFLAIAIFADKPVWLKWLYNCLFLVYISFTTAFLLYFNFYFSGCKMCSVKYGFIDENGIATIALTILLGIIFLVTEYYRHKMKIDNRKL